MTDDRQQQAELHEHFRATLVQRRQQVIDQWNVLRNQQWNSGGVQLLRKWMFEIADGSSSFGYLSLEEHARELLHRLNGVIGGATRSMEVIAGMAASVERLKIQIDKVLSLEAAMPTAAVARVATSKTLAPWVHIIDSDAESVQLLAAVLAAQGYRVQVFADTAQLAGADAESPTVVVFGAIVPGGEGVDLAAIIPPGAAPSRRPIWASR